MKNTLIIFLTISAVVWVYNCTGQTDDKPNIVLIVADDLGYGDLSCFGSTDIYTPNLDKLAREGVMLTNFYSNGPSCTPTRTALITGRYQQRVGGLETAIGIGNVGRYEEARKLSDQGELGLPVGFNTLPAILNQKGYNTALIGKWHLGEDKKFNPVAHGFDYTVGPWGAAVDYFHHTGPQGNPGVSEKPDFFRNGEHQHREGYYLTHLITDESVEWINIQKPEKPFFLYIPYTAPHDPLQGPEDYSPERLTGKNWKDGTSETYKTTVETLDKGIGEIIDKLEDKGFSDNTLVIFFSDNGPAKMGSTGPFSGRKGSLFEGGIHVPCIIKWPGRIKPGTTSNRIAISMDITASISGIINGNPPRRLDGENIIEHITASRESYARTLFWRRKRGSVVLKAVRDSNLKYVIENQRDSVREYLFDLESDPGEKNNLKEEKSHDFIRLKKLLDEWETDVQPERYVMENK